MLDALIMLVEAVGGLLELVLGVADLCAIFYDIYAWFRGSENRAVRRAARLAGEPPPPRDVWTRRVLWLTALVFVLTSVLLLRLARVV